MDLMFWIWLGVIIVTAIVEFATMEVVSIWFTFGAVIPLILSATKAVNWEIQIIIFVVISAVLIVSLRGVTKKFLQKNSEGRTNLETLIGQKYRMLSRTDFETMGSLKVNDVVWTAIGDEQQTIEKDEVVEVVKIKGNKLLVRKADAGDKVGVSNISSTAKQPKASSPKAENTKDIKTSSKETEFKKSSSKSGTKTANNSSKSKNTSKNAVKSNSNVTTKKSTTTKNSTAKTTKSSTAKKKVNK